MEIDERLGNPAERAETLPGLPALRRSPYKPQARRKQKRRSPASASSGRRSSRRWSRRARATRRPPRRSRRSSTRSSSRTTGATWPPRILAGERDPAALLAGLDAADTLIAGDVLRGLGFERGSGGTAEAAEAEEGGASEQQQGLTLEQLLDLVAQACRPDAPAGLAERLHAFTRGLAGNAGAAPEHRALGRALNAVLSGERAPDL